MGTKKTRITAAVLAAGTVVSLTVTSEASAAPRQVNCKDSSSVRIYTEDFGSFCFQGEENVINTIKLPDGSIRGVTGVFGGKWEGGLSVDPHDGTGRWQLVAYSAGRMITVLEPARGGDVRTITFRMPRR
ncbi:hypothetical protein AB0P21_19645 [Kribbella sp. NPDC056861]|uniref:hypothetical protein n=1 Tax=Kribbella sp. NPDC056861 TaxID=3154857 RepID=UPI003431FC34